MDDVIISNEEFANPPPQQERQSLAQIISRLRLTRGEIEEMDFTGALSEEFESSERFKEAAVMLAEEIVERELLSDALAERIKEMQARKERLDNSADNLRQVVLQAMDIRQEKSIKDPVVTLTVKPLDPEVKVSDESLIPTRFFVPQPPKLDKKALKEAVLEDGEVVPGVEKGNPRISLTIKRK